MTPSSHGQLAPDGGVPDRFGPYRLVGRIGRGAMGEVYQAVDQQDRDVALKIMRSETAEDDGARARFLQEAQAVAGLQHRNIVTVFDIGVIDSAPYIAMELLSGTTLAARLSSGEPISLDGKLDVIIQLCEGLQFAHEHGIVHRDVKPANIWILPNGGVKLLDFGVAKIEGTALTHPGNVVGSVAYMAPEQLNGKEIDSRVDIFAAGAVLYEMLAGRRPFEADSVTGVIHKVLHSPAPSLRLSCPDVSDEIAAAVDLALRKDPAGRYGQAADFGTDLRLARYEVQQRPPDATLVAGAATLVRDVGVARSGRPPDPIPQAAWAVAVGERESPTTAGTGFPARLERPAVVALPAAVRRALPFAGLAAVVTLIVVFVSRKDSAPPNGFQLAVQSTPAGATITLDGVATGTMTPATLTVTTAPRRIGLVLAGFESVDAQLPALSATQPTELRYALRRVLRVQSEPSGARVLFDGRDTGLVTPADVPLPDPPPTFVELQLSGRSPQKVPMTQAALDTGEVRVTFAGESPTRDVESKASSGSAADETPVRRPPSSPVSKPGSEPVSVHLTGSYAFEVSGCATVSPAASEHDLQVAAPCSLRLRAPEYLLDSSLRIEATSGRMEIAAPQLARVQLRSRYESCTVILAGHALGSPPVDRELAAGSYTATIQCSDKSYTTRALSIGPGRSTWRLDEYLLP